MAREQSEDAEEQRPTRCRACGTDLVGLYCHACGQGHQYPRLRARALVEDFFEGLIELDSRIFRTVWGLTTRPGELVRDYLRGRRIVYINPFKYALVSVTIAHVVIPWVVPGLTSSAGPTSELLEWGKWLNVAALPVFALLMQLLFRRQRLRWIEHFVLVLYAMGHVYLLEMLLTTLLLPLGESALGAVGLVPIAWLGWTARGAFGTGWLSSLVRALVVFVLIQLLNVGVVWLAWPELLPFGG